MESSSKLKTGPVSSLAKQQGMTLIESGEFLMGSPRNEEGHNADEKINRVRISQPFWIKTGEVTIEEWNSIVPDYQKKGILVYHLTHEILRKVCTSSGPQEGNYSAEVYQTTQARNLLEEVNFSDDLWSKAKNPRTYQLNLKI